MRNNKSKNQECIYNLVNIYDRGFLQKQLTSFSCQLFLQKRFTIDVKQGSNYVSNCIGNNYNINKQPEISRKF